MIAVDISNALPIDGWMWPPELTWLAEQAIQHEVIVEWGSYCGRSTRVLADHCPGTVYAVDNWEMLWEQEKTFGQFKKNTEGARGRIVPVTQDHRIITQWIYRRPSMVFIDGDHRYDCVCQDIEFWSQWILPGGLLCGHDMWIPEAHYGIENVSRAVYEYFPHAKIVPDTTIWYTQV